MVYYRNFCYRNFIISSDVFFNGLFAVDNIDASKLGIGNKFGFCLNKYKAFLKRFKHWNKPLYVTAKIIVLILVLYYIFN